MRRRSLRTGKSRSSFIDSIATIRNLDEKTTQDPSTQRNNNSNGVVIAESKYRRQSLRTSESRSSFIDAIAAIHLDDKTTQETTSTQRNVNDDGEIMENKRRRSLRTMSSFIDSVAAIHNVEEATQADSSTQRNVRQTGTSRSSFFDAIAAIHLEEEIRDHLMQQRNVTDGEVTESKHCRSSTSRSSFFDSIAATRLEQGSQDPSTVRTNSDGAVVESKRYRSLRTSTSRSSFFDSITAIRLQEESKDQPMPQRSVSDGEVMESRHCRQWPPPPPRKAKSSRDIAAVDESDARRQRRRFAYVAPPPRIEGNLTCTNSSPTLTMASSRGHSPKLSFPPPPPPPRKLRTVHRTRKTMNRTDTFHSMNRRYANVAPPTKDESASSKSPASVITEKFHRQSIKASFPPPPPPPPPPLMHHSRKSHGKTIQAEHFHNDSNMDLSLFNSMAESSSVQYKLYNAKEYKDMSHCSSDHMDSIIDEVAQPSPRMMIETCPPPTIPNVFQLKNQLGWAMDVCYS
eukprot:scaffold13986_cov58-Cyclotella_meneghiniana.AAC.1